MIMSIKSTTVSTLKNKLMMGPLVGWQNLKKLIECLLIHDTVEGSWALETWLPYL